MKKIKTQNRKSTFSKLVQDEVRRGKPRKHIDFRILDELCNIQCTVPEISAVMGMCAKILSERVKEETGKTIGVYRDELASVGKTSLRRLQFASAKEGSVPMQVWLGKQWLNQSMNPIEKLQTGAEILSLEQAQSILLNDAAMPTKQLESDNLNS